MQEGLRQDAIAEEEGQPAFVSPIAVAFNMNQFDNEEHTLPKGKNLIKIYTMYSNSHLDNQGLLA